MPHERASVCLFSRLTVVVIVLSFVFSAIPNVVTVSRASSPTVIRIDNPEPQADAYFGQAVKGIGDIDSDGIGDLAVGAPGADKVYLFSGSDRSLIRTLNDPDGLTGYDFGFALDDVGDLDGDGVGDMAMGAPFAFAAIIPFPGTPIPEWGRAFISSGATGRLIHTADPGVSFRGHPDDYFQLGFAVAGLGDVNDDGISDFAVSAPVLNILNNWGEVYAFSGADGRQLWVAGEPGFSNVKQPIPSFGYSMTGIGDVTGDGRGDLLVAAPYFDPDPDPNNNLLAGEAYVLSGYDGTIFRTHKNPS
ncbi:MAG: integrin alpha, partial [Thermoplasmata archaeon]